MTTPRSQMLLASDINFQRRLASLLLQEAAVVASEDPGTPDHAARKALADKILTSPQGMAAQLAPAVSNGTNLLAAETQFDFEGGFILTTAVDAAIRSQLATMWNILAGV